MPTRRGTVSIDDMSDNNDLLLASFKAMLDSALKDHRNIFEAQLEEAEELHRQQRDEDWEAIQNLHATHRSIMTQQSILAATSAFEFPPATPRSTELPALASVHQQPPTPHVVPAPVHPLLASAPVIQPVAVTPRIIFSEKMVWPKIPSTDDFKQLQGWRSKFLSTLTSCDLADLYNPIAKDLHLTSCDEAMKKRLHFHICSCLPDSHPMITNDAYYSDGLLLWHDFTATIKQQPSFQLRRQLHTVFLTSTFRDPSEDVFTYYSRLLADANRINEGQPTPSISPADLRQQLLLTLGSEFTFIVEAISEQRLDPSYLSDPIQTVLQKLQTILTSKHQSPRGPTTATAGYALATVRTTPPRETELVAMNYRIDALTDAMTNVVSQLVAASRHPSPHRPTTPPRRPATPPTLSLPQLTREARRVPKYCWTHGAVGHMGTDCLQPSPDHKPGATFADRQGGSEYKTTRRAYK